MCINRYGHFPAPKAGTHFGRIIDGDRIKHPVVRIRRQVLFLIDLAAEVMTSLSSAGALPRLGRMATGTTGTNPGEPPDPLASGQ